MNEDPRKLIDLEPHKWRSDREKPREPFFGPGAGPLLVQLTIGAFALGLLAVVLLGAGYVKGLAYNLVGGSPPTQTSLPPGNYTWTPEKGLQPAPDKR